LDRINRLKKLAFAQNSFDGYLIFNGTNQLYFLGFPGTTALLISAEKEATAYVYGVNYEQAKAESKDVDVQLVRADESLTAKLAAQAKTLGIKSLAVDGLSVNVWQSLVKELEPQVTLEVTNRPVQALRAVKESGEIALMRKAGELTSIAMEAASEAVKPGVREFEVAAELEYAMRRRGGGPTAFESIVASGTFSAFPHGGCCDRIIREGDLVVVDIGATFNYYCSDMTRTFVAGNHSERQQRIYDVVLDAQSAAVKRVKAGVPIAEVDAAARKVIASAGYDEYFVHRLGHGVGLEVHEFPSLTSQSKDALEAGNVVSVEPGIYLPGFGGVRIEDTVLVTEQGAEKFTAGPYKLTRE
jgi:Xaa-Pro dipeptidase